jgi:hypothetical protein
MLVTGLQADFGWHSVSQLADSQVLRAMISGSVSQAVPAPPRQSLQFWSPWQARRSVQHWASTQRPQSLPLVRPEQSAAPPVPELVELLLVLVDVLLELVLVLVLVLELDEEVLEVPPVAPLPPVPLLLHAPCAKAMPTRPPARRIHG